MSKTVTWTDRYVVEHNNRAQKFRVRRPEASVEWNGDRGDKDDSRYLTLVIKAERGQTSPYTITHECLILNMDKELQRQVYNELRRRFGDK